MYNEINEDFSQNYFRIALMNANKRLSNQLVVNDVILNN